MSRSAWLIPARYGRAGHCRRHRPHRRAPGAGVTDGLRGLRGAVQRDARSSPGTASATGHGMSQYGAQGAAKQGLTCRRSWPSTTRARRSPPPPAACGWLMTAVNRQRLRRAERRRAHACARRAARRRTPRPGRGVDPVAPAQVGLQHRGRTPTTAAWHNGVHPGRVTPSSSGRAPLGPAHLRHHAQLPRRAPADRRGLHRRRARWTTTSRESSRARCRRRGMAEAAARAGRRRPDLRRLRPRRPPHPLLRHLRHDVVPGLRRRQRRGLAQQRRRRRDRRPGASATAGSRRSRSSARAAAGGPPPAACRT